MDAFWKAAGLVLLTTILGITIGKTEKDFALLLIIMACCITARVTASYLEPVLDLLWELQSLGNLQDGLVKTMVKAVGITVVAELAGMICYDAGNQALGKALQFTATAAVLYLSLPAFNALLTLMQEILGEL